MTSYLFSDDDDGGGRSQMILVKELDRKHEEGKQVRQVQAQPTVVNPRCQTANATGQSNSNVLL